MGGIISLYNLENGVNSDDNETNWWRKKLNNEFSNKKHVVLGGDSLVLEKLKNPEKGPFR